MVKLIVAGIAASLLAAGPAGAEEDRLSDPAVQAARDYLGLSIRVDTLARRAGDRIIGLEERVTVLECLVFTLLETKDPLEQPYSAQLYREC